jgi:hypothetical protein
MIRTYIDLIKINGKQVYGDLLLSPLSSPFNYSSSIVGSETIVLHEEGAGVVVDLVPTAYTARLTGYNADTQFQFDLTGVADESTVTASNYLVSEPINQEYTSSYAFRAGNANTASLALMAVSASYVENAFSYPDITDDTVNNFVGINQPSPTSTLDVFGNINFTGVLLQGNTPFNPMPDITDDLTNNFIGISNTNPQHALDINGACGDSTTRDYLFDVGGQISFVNANGGNFGIGTMSPQNIVHIGAERGRVILGNNDIGNGDIGVAVQTPNGGGSAVFQAGDAGNSNITFGWQSAGSAVAQGSASAFIESYAGAAPLMLQRFGGNVGIGVPYDQLPQYKLDVNGGINASQGYQLPNYNDVNNPAEGLLAYNFDTHTTTFYNGSMWV